jgi:hypothetical protein
MPHATCARRALHDDTIVLLGEGLPSYVYRQAVTHSLTCRGHVNPQLASQLHH